jgi:hypothetical protein
VINFDAIPDELKALPQWVVWKEVIIPGDPPKITKPPFDPKNPICGADVAVPSTWGTYDEAVACYHQGQAFLSGIGFVFTKNDPYFGIDIDDEDRVDPKHLEERRAVVNMLGSSMVTYTETSPSGKGYHMIGRGKLPMSGRQINRLKLEFYYAERFFTITGRTFAGYEHITDQQVLIDQLVSSMPKPEKAEVTDTENFRRLDLEDAELMQLAADYDPSFLPKYNCEVACGPGDWSGSFFRIVLILDRFTGSIEQIERLVYSSPMVLQAPSSGSGETRLHKARRTLIETLGRVRANNNIELAEIDHGKQIWQAFVESDRKKAEIAADALRQAEEAVAGLSRNASSLLGAFPGLEHEHKQLTYPPGVTGDFVRAVEKASYNPFMKFAIPGTLAVLSGIVSRGYKLPTGSGLNCNYVLAAPSNSGKTQIMKVWERFLSAATNRMPQTLMGAPKSRIVSSSTSSIQAMMEDFQEVPSITWFVEECKSLLSAMTDPKSHVDSQLRDKFNELYDCGNPTTRFSGPKSMAAKKLNLEPILNLNVSTFWTTTTSKFDLSDEDALDGFMSRIIVIRHNSRAGDPVRYQSPIPPNLLEILTQRLIAARDLDDRYKMNEQEATDNVVAVNTNNIEEVAYEYLCICHSISTKATEGGLPHVYGAISRVPLTAQRMAALFAVMDNPYAPVVTIEHYRWAFGYLLQNLVSLLSDMDQGALGSRTNDEQIAIVEGIKYLLKKKKHKENPTKSELRELMKNRKPFSQAKGEMFGRGKVFSNAYEQMLKDGIFAEMPQPTGKAGRPAIVIVPNLDDPIWGMQNTP